MIPSNESYTGPRPVWDGAYLSPTDIDTLGLYEEPDWPKDPLREGGPGWNEAEKYLEWVDEYVDGLTPAEREQLQADIHQRRAEDFVLERVLIERRSDEVQG